MRTRTLVNITMATALLVVTASAQAEDADLKQTVSDLTSQTDDKERMDVLGSSKVEVSQLRTWLGDATNAIKEEAEKKCRQIFERIRSQLKLVDEQTAHAKLDDEARKLEQQIAEIKTTSETLSRKVQDKKAKLRALKMKD
jgi:hypothetical protein